MLDLDAVRQCGIADGGTRTGLDNGTFGTDFLVGQKDNLGHGRVYTGAAAHIASQVLNSSTRWPAMAARMLVFMRRST